MIAPPPASECDSRYYGTTHQHNRSHAPMIRPHGDDCTNCVHPARKCWQCDLIVVQVTVQAPTGIDMTAWVTKLTITEWP